MNAESVPVLKNIIFETQQEIQGGGGYYPPPLVADVAKNAQ